MLTGTGGAHYLHLRCFLEGIEVPVIGASVTSQLNAPATATIQIVPSDVLATLLPRTTVHLFFLDSVAFSAREEGSNPDDHDYRLLFCGEVFDTSIAKSGHGSRSASIRCMDFSNVWDTNYSYIMRYAVGAQESAEGGAIIKNVSGFVAGGVESNPFDDIVNSPADVIARMATASGAGNPSAPGKGTVLGGLLAVLELLSGIQGLYIGINPWATVHERRCRVMDSLVSDNGKTAKSLFDQQVFADWLQQRTGTAASVISFRQIINLILGYIYYDVVTNVTPPYFAGDDGNGLPGRNVPEWDVNAGAEVGTGTDSEALSLDELSSLDKPVASSKIAGLDTTFWTYCTELLTNLQAECDGKTWGWGDDRKGKPIGFMVSSGHRNLAQQQALNDAKTEDGDGAKASTGAHLSGFAIDIASTGNGATGTMPYMLGPRIVNKVTNTSQVGLPIAKVGGENVSERFRAAIWEMENKDGTSSDIATVTDFEALVEHIRYDDPMKLGHWGSDEAFEYDVNTVRNAVQFWELYSKAVKATNKATTTGITGSWGGDWKTPRDPLWGLFGLGKDPVHVQDQDWKKKTASPLAGFAPPTEVTAIMGKGQSREKLKSFIFRPNIWFCAPPLCNVVLPHMYESMSVSRQMMRETTRLQLDAFNQFYESNVLNTFYYAPQFQGVEGGKPANHIIGEGMGSVTKTIIMDHEVFCGIIPKMERISEISFYAKQSGQGTDLSTTDESEVGSSAARATITNYGERVAHYNLLTHRYAARSGSFNGPFNPYLVCGFPAVVVDELNYSGASISDLNQIKEGNRLATKVQWLGCIDSLSHTYDQSGARTSATLKYVRSHRTGDNTDDLLSEAVTDQGVFKVQDANYKPPSPGSSIAWPVSSVKTKTAEDESEGNFSDSWIFQYLSKTLGVDAPQEIIAKGPSILLRHSTEADASDVLAEYQALTANSADFSNEQVTADSTIKGPTGTAITEATWSGAETWAVLQLTAAQPTDDLSDFLSFSTLSSMTIMTLARAGALGPYLDTIRSHKALATFQTRVPLGSGDVTFFGTSQINVPILLPGDTLTVAYAESQGSVAGSRDLPIEEAIRPPFIDKGVYTNAPSNTEGYAKIDLLYRHLFNSPSIIHSLLQASATPYDGMDVHSVEQAVDYVVATAATQEDGDSQRSYAAAITSRPIASLPDILAPKGWVPTLKSDGTYQWNSTKSPSGVWGVEKDDIKLTGGFHSNAVTGRHNGLSGTSEVSSPGETLKFGSRLEFLDLENTLASRLQTEAKVTLGEDASIRLDPRAPRAERVKEYVADIGGTSALRKLDFGSTGFIRTPSGRGEKG